MISSQILIQYQNPPLQSKYIKKHPIHSKFQSSTKSSHFTQTNNIKKSHKIIPNSHKKLRFPKQSLQLKPNLLPSSSFSKNICSSTRNTSQKIQQYSKENYKKLFEIWKKQRWIGNKKINGLKMKNGNVIFERKNKRKNKNRNMQKKEQKNIRKGRKDFSINKLIQMNNLLMSCELSQIIQEEEIVQQKQQLQQKKQQLNNSQQDLLKMLSSSSQSSIQTSYQLRRLPKLQPAYKKIFHQFQSFHISQIKQQLPNLNSNQTKRFFNQITPKPLQIKISTEQSHPQHFKTIYQTTIYCSTDYHNQSKITSLQNSQNLKFQMQTFITHLNSINFQQDIVVYDIQDQPNQSRSYQLEVNELEQQIQDQQQQQQLPKFLRCKKNMKIQRNEEILYNFYNFQKIIRHEQQFIQEQKQIKYKQQIQVKQQKCKNILSIQKINLKTIEQLQYSKQISIREKSSQIMNKANFINQKP